MNRSPIFGLVLLAVVISLFAAPVAYADVTTHLFEGSSYQGEISGKTTEFSLQDYLDAEDNNLDISFANQDGEELSVQVDKIDNSANGNVCIYISKGTEKRVPVFGAIAYVLNVSVSRSSENVLMYAENFLPGTTYDDLKDCASAYECSGYVSSLLVDSKLAPFATKNYGYIKEADDSQLIRACLKSNPDKQVRSLPASETVTEEFFNDQFLFTLPVEDRVTFDTSYMITSNLNTVPEDIANQYTSANRAWRTFVYFTYAEDKDAADKITALPEAAEVTLESADQIAEARAAYDLLAQWEGAQDAIDATKLEAAEAALAELQKAAATTELEQAIAEAEKVDVSKLTDAQKKALQDAIDEAKAALANGELTADQIASAKEAIAGATAVAQGQVAEAVKAAEEAAKAKTELKANPMTVKAKTVKAKAKKKTTIKKAKAFTVKGAQGKVTFQKKSGNKKIKVSRAGKVTVKKGLKKGKTYKVKVQVSAAGNAQYKPATKTVTLKVKVK